MTYRCRCCACRGLNGEHNERKTKKGPGGLAKRCEVATKTRTRNQNHVPAAIEPATNPRSPISRPACINISTSRCRDASASEPSRNSMCATISSNRAASVLPATATAGGGNDTAVPPRSAAAALSSSRRSATSCSVGCAVAAAPTGSVARSSLYHRCGRGARGCSMGARRLRNRCCVLRRRRSSRRDRVNGIFYGERWRWRNCPVLQQLAEDDTPGTCDDATEDRCCRCGGAAGGCGRRLGGLCCRATGGCEAEQKRHCCAAAAVRTGVADTTRLGLRRPLRVEGLGRVDGAAAVSANVPAGAARSLQRAVPTQASQGQPRPEGWGRQLMVASL